MVQWKPISVKEVKQKKDRGGDFLLLDVRDQEENKTAKIEGALLIPLKDLEKRVGELAAHRNREIILHCHHGKRSEKAADFLASRGFTHLRSMTGGIEAWSNEIDPSVPRY